jgi:hypothetical protein
MSSSAPAPTFRDPAGSLSIEDDVAVRRIRETATQSVLEFLDSPFCRRMQERGDLIAADVDTSGHDLRLIHPKIPIPTYPWEWTPSQWVAAAELTLTLCDEGLAEGWILKDATPLNILFDGRRPVLVDILSFERRDPHSSIWLAYGQYVRTFLLPLVIHRVLGWPLVLTFFKRDGYEPAELFAATSWRQRLTRDVFWPVTLPALIERKRGAAAPAIPAAGRVKDPGMAEHILRRMLKDLRTRTRRALSKEARSKWSEYTGTLTHYTAAESAQKRAWVQAVLDEFHPRRVLDIGANTGEFSALAAQTGAQVVALERDAASADRLFRMSRDRGLAIQTIHCDLARPTPAAGWDNSESSSLLGRLEGEFDLVLMLAVIHHLS